MMRLVADAGAGLNAAFLLARGRPDGVGRIGGEAAAIKTSTVVNSFWAILACLPPFLILRIIDWHSTAIPAHAGWEIADEVAAYAVDWLGFAVLSHLLAGRLGRSAAWPRYIVVWNWCTLVQYLLMLAAAIPALAGAPDWVSETAMLVATGWTLWIEWFATRVALGVPGGAAAALTILDQLLGFFIYALIGIASS